MNGRISRGHRPLDCIKRIQHDRSMESRDEWCIATSPVAVSARDCGTLAGRGLHHPQPNTSGILDRPTNQRYPRCACVWGVQPAISRPPGGCYAAHPGAFRCVTRWFCLVPQASAVRISSFPPGRHLIIFRHGGQTLRVAARTLGANWCWETTAHDQISTVRNLGCTKTCGMDGFLR